MKSGLVSGRLACKSSNSQMLNNIVSNISNFPSIKNHIMCGPRVRILENYLGNFPNSTTIGSVSIIGTRGAVGGKTGKTSVLPWFFKIERGGSSSGALPCYGCLFLVVCVRCSSGAPVLYVIQHSHIRLNAQTEWIKSPKNLNKLNHIQIEIPVMVVSQVSEFCPIG